MTENGINTWWVFNILQAARLETRECHQLLHDGLQKLQAWLDFFLGVGGLCLRAHRGDVHPVCGHVVSVGHHRYVDVCMDNRSGLSIYVHVVTYCYVCREVKVEVKMT